MRALVLVLALLAGCDGRATSGCDGDYTVTRSITSGSCLTLVDTETVSPPNCGATSERTESPFENGCVVRVTREGIADENEWLGTATVELDCPGRPLCTVRREIEARR